MTVSGHVETVQKWNERSEEPEEQDGTVPRPLSQQSEGFGGDFAATDGPPENGLYVLMYLYAGKFLTHSLKRLRQEIFEISAKIFEILAKIFEISAKIFEISAEMFEISAEIFEISAVSWIFGIFLKKHHNIQAEKKHSQSFKHSIQQWNQLWKWNINCPRTVLQLNEGEKRVAVEKIRRYFQTWFLGLKSLYAMQCSKTVVNCKASKLQNFFASLNISFGLIREALHRFNGCTKLRFVPGRAAF